MKKKLVALCFVVFSILCAFGCGNDPYKNMNLVTTSTNEVVQLNIKEVKTTGVPTYEYDSYSFDVQVQNVGDDVDKGVVITGGENIVKCSSQYLGNGVTRINVKPVSYDQTGRCTLVIKTLEGNKSVSVDFNVDLRVNNFLFNQDALKVVAKGQQVNLSDVSKYINFDPVLTSQTNIKFEIVKPVDGVVEGNSESTYTYTDDGKTYATIENNILTTFTDCVYPHKNVQSIVGGAEQFESIQCITIKATYADSSVSHNPDGSVRLPERFIDVEVIDDCSNVQMLMNYQKNSSNVDNNGLTTFPVEKNSKGEYDVTLLNPNYRYGVIYEDYYLKRNLLFDFGEVTDSFNPNDYMVTTSPILEDANVTCPIALSFGNTPNSFEITAQNAGTYSHKFIVDNIKYPGVLNREIIVNFNVIDAPTDIKVNGTATQDKYKVYDYYDNSFGARFNIDLNNVIGKFNYFVFVEDSSLIDNLHIYKSDGTEQVFAKIIEEMGTNYIISSKENVNYSNFKDNETFYIKHNFDEIPETDIKIYVGVMLSMASESYSAEVKDTYFDYLLISFPISLEFENGLRSLDFTQSKYMVDLTNTDYASSTNDDKAIKLLDLPKGQTVENVIDTIIYDKELVRVYDMTVDGVTSLFLKCNSEYKIGKTNLTVKTKNGILKTVSVETFIPSIYAKNIDLDPTAEGYMPFGMEFDSDDTLYYFTVAGNPNNIIAEINNPEELNSLYKNVEEAGLIEWGQYTSLQTLFMLSNSSIKINFYDYLLAGTVENKIVNKIDITDIVNVSFNYENYAEFRDGVLYTSNEVTDDIGKPIIMTITYKFGYMATTEMGTQEYRTRTMTQNINLYVYMPLQGVQVTSSKYVDLYLDESLGIFDKGYMGQDLSTHQIQSDFVPNEKELGSDWNNSWYNEFKPINLFYDFGEALDSYIFLSGGEQLIIKSLDGSKTITLKYSDIFCDRNRGIGLYDYTCTVQCSISEELRKWILEESGYATNEYDEFLRNNIFNHNITMVVNVYITQFSKLQNINSIKINAKFANKISEFKVDIPEDGVYFELKDDADNLTKNVVYYINSADVVNKEIKLFNSNNAVFKASVKADVMGNSGTITITANGSAGIEYLIAVPADNIKSIDPVTGAREYYDKNLVQTFRIKVADGSVEFPFEIRSIDDYDRMIDNISTHNYFNYVLTRNINWLETNEIMASFTQDASLISKLNDFSLNGQHNYYRNEELVTINNSIYNFNIRQNVNSVDAVNIGLFGTLNSKVSIKNLNVINANITLNINSLSKELNVGILAGSADGSKISNTSVSGTIKVTNNDAVNTGIVNLGGIIGIAKANVKITGMPADYVQGFANSNYSANVYLDYSEVVSNDVGSTLNNYTYNVGGLVGYDKSSATIDSQTVVSVIKGTNYKSSVGSVVGRSSTSKLKNITVYPNIVITDASSEESVKEMLKNNIISVGLMVGAGDGQNTISETSVYNSKVYFVKEDVTLWQNKLNVMISTANYIRFGGIIGSADYKNEILYTYVRGFYNEDLSDSYKGNIYVNSTHQNSAVGGLIGYVDGSKVDIRKSYFQADIASNKDSQNGLLIGHISNLSGTNSNLLDSYAIGKLGLIDGDNIVPVSDINDRANIFGNWDYMDYPGRWTAFTEQFVSKLVEGTTFKSTTNNSLNIDNVYGVINDSIYFIGNYNGTTHDICGFTNGNKDIVELFKEQNGYTYDNFGETFWKEYLDYSLIIDNGENVAGEDDVWLWNIGANKVNGVAMPILFNDGNNKAMYDLVPERISIDKINTGINGIFDISYNNKTQILMFLNSNDDGAKKDWYDISIVEGSAIKIKFEGQTILTRYIEINSDVEIFEDSKGKFIELVGNRIRPVAPGLVTLTIRSVLDKTVKLDIVIKIIKGITDFDLYQNNNETYGYDKVEYQKTTVYIDDASEYAFINQNKINKVLYKPADDLGYRLELLESDGVININGKDYSYRENENNIYYLKTNKLIAKGVKFEKVIMKVTPFVILDDVEFISDYYLLTNLEKTYTFEVNARAKQIDVDKDSIKLAPKNVSDFKAIVETSNIIFDSENLTFRFLSPLNIRVNSKVFEIDFDETIEYSATLNGDIYTIKFDYEIDYQLIKLRFKNIQVTDIVFDAESNQNTYKVIFDIFVEFNHSYYRLNANSFDLNTISYDYTFYPSSNKKVYDTINISISPAILTEIFTNFYTKGELLKDYEFERYPEENESNFVVPGRSGLLKITLDEEFSNSSYITVTLDNKYRDFVRLSQMAGKIEELSNKVNYSNIESIANSITSYENIMFAQEILNENNYGIRLSKLTLNFQDKNYFNKTYYVKVDMDKYYGELENLVLVITSYQVIDGRAVRHYEKTVNYTITQLPQITAKIDNSFSTYIGVGVKKPIDITFKQLTKNISFDIYDENNDLIKNTPVAEMVYVVDNAGNRVNNEFDINYISNGNKYYLCIDITATELLGKTYRINLFTQELVFGVVEETSANVKVNIVNFEIEDIAMNRAIDGVITIKHGEQLTVTTNVKYKDIVVGDQSLISAYKDKLDHEHEGEVTLAEYAMSGTKLTKVINKEVQTLVEGDQLRLSKLELEGGDYIYKPIVIGGNYDYVSIYNDTLKYGVYEYLYTVLKGTSITYNEGVKLKLNVPYYYVDGKLIIGADMLGHEIKEVEVTLIVKDNSTYDHPNPIETQQDLINAAKSNGGDYILLNNLELNNWEPIDATFNSLDGNGYIITVNDFNFSKYRNESEANVGIFATISETTLLKNITVDVSPLLVSSTEMLKRTTLVSGSKIDNYNYGAKIDIAFVQNVNFGILTGVNNGSITNAKIINRKSTDGINSDNESAQELYYHIVTTQGYLDNSEVTTKIGAIAGVNSSTGAITNSFAGVDATSNGTSFIQGIVNPSIAKYNNTDDKLTEIEIYPFTIAGGNILGGLVAENSGFIGNSYAKGLGLYNTYPAVTNSQTAGLVATNLGTITSCFVESELIDNGRENSTYRAKEDYFIIESTGNVGGFVFENSSVIENSYSNVYLETQSAFTGEFVFKNNATGVINNVYTTSTDRNSLAHGKFTGIDTNGRDILNSGTYNNCYYLVLEDEIENVYESATAIKTIENFVDEKMTWSGFSFASAVNDDGIWKISEKGTPKLAATLQETISFRKLTDVTVVENPTEDDSETNETPVEGEGDNEIPVEGESGEPENESPELPTKISIYNYSYIGYNLGSIANPLIIDKAENFDKYIIDNGSDINIDGKIHRVFGVAQKTNFLGNINAVRHVRLVNHLDFENITTAVIHENYYLYNVIFAGVLDGNGLSLKNLNINNDTTQLDNFGLFAQVGVESKVSTEQTIVKNLNLNIRTYQHNGSSRAGILAGTIVNSNIINVKIDGSASTNENIIVSGSNMAGALAGLIYADRNSEVQSGKISLFDIEIKNIRVQASYGSLGDEITDFSKDTSNGFYNEFLVKNVEAGNDESTKGSFVSLYNIKTNKTEYESADKSVDRTKLVSYAGAVAGVLDANNSSKVIDSGKIISDYRTNPDENTIDNVIVKENVTITIADNAGGLFGYVAEHTLVKNSQFVLGGSQLINARNFAGGLVGENHGIIEQCSIALARDAQDELDEKLMSRSRTSLTNEIFDIQSSATDFNVATGGIAGYSSNGVIIDSYSKVNVTKPQSYIAGGIVGYSENYNYIGYVYSTGAVYGMFITGGIIGLQVNSEIFDYEAEDGTKITKEYYAEMHKVYALTDWDSKNDLYDIRDSITKILYNDQKVLYQKDGFYYNFHIKMPEIGNMGIIVGGTETENPDDDIVVSPDINFDSYAKQHSKYFVGSVIGNQILNIGNIQQSDIYKYENEVENYDGILFLSQEDKEAGVKIQEKYNLDKSNYVYSNTFGMYSSTGSANAGDKQDTYFSATFNLDIDAETKLKVYSYRLAYRDPDGINAYDNLSIADSSEYFDIFNYPQIFTQEYTQQILGGYSNIPETTSVETRNLFKYNYDSQQRYNMIYVNDSFVNEYSDEVWEMKGSIPEFSNGIYKFINCITNKDELTSALTSASTGKNYEVKPNATDYTITMDDIDNTSKMVNYMYPVRDTYRGINDENGNKPKIVFNVVVPNPDEYGNTIVRSTINTIFNMISGGVFDNIEFIFNFKNIDSQATKEFEAFGMIANNLQNVYIMNCKFTLNVDNTDGDMIFEDRSNTTFDAENLGLLFGDISNSILTNNEFVLNFTDTYEDESDYNNIILDHSSIENFGLFAGVIYNSTIRDNSFDINIGNINLTNHSKNFNFGLIAGVFNNSTIDNFVIKHTEINNDDELEEKELKLHIEDNYKVAIDENANINNYTNNISAGFGVANNSSIHNQEIKNIIIEYVTDDGNKKSNLSFVSAYSQNTNYSNIKVLSNNAFSADNLNMHTLSFGSIIGYDASNSELQNVSNMSNIDISGNGTTIMELNVGGLIGTCNYSSDLLNNAYNDNIININNSATGVVVNIDQIDKYAVNNIGGIIGLSNSSVAINNVYNAGKIEAKTSHETSVKTNIGGIIGCANGSTKISSFSVISDFIVGPILNADQEFENGYVSGVVGYNNGLLQVNYGFVYLELPKNNEIYTSMISNGAISSLSNDVYYPQEFVSENYTNDSKFYHYSMADIYRGDNVEKYTTINEYSILNNLVKTNKFTQYNIGNVYVLLPKNLSVDIANIESSLEISNTTEINRFKAEEFSVTSELSNGYYVICEDIVGLNNISLSAVVAGRSTSDGKVNVMFNSAPSGASVTSYAVSENNGVLSNIYLCTTNQTNEQNVLNVALVRTNNGLITDVYVYGYTSSNHSIAERNNGRIYASASANIFKPNTITTDNFGLVYDNYGQIKDCYSSNFGYTASEYYVTNIYGVCKNNYDEGVVENCYYYIPEVMLYDNELSSKGSTRKGYMSVAYTENPGFAERRTSIWTKENGHAQLIGIKDIPGAIVIRPQVINGASVTKIENIVQLDDMIKNINNSIQNTMRFNYQIEFYVKEENIPEFNVLRFNDGVKFMKYISNLPIGNYLPENTVVIIEGNVQIDESITFSIPESSVLLGVEYYDTNSNSWIERSNIVYTGKETSAEIIYKNKGIMAGVRFKNLKFSNINRYNNFAPIMYNEGTIYSVEFVSCEISANNSATYVSAFVYINNSTGIIKNCELTFYYINGIRYYNLFAINNKGGVIINAYANSGSIIGGTSWSGGNNGLRY